MTNEHRRSFLKKSALATAGIGLGVGMKSHSSPEAPAKAGFDPKDPFVGIQMAAHSILDEGIDYCLDLLKEKAEINTLILYTHTYYGAGTRPVHVLGDHGKGIKDNSKRKLPHVWVRHHDEYFKDIRVSHQKVDSSFEFNDRDVFSELRKPLDERNMKVYARILEASANHRKLIPGYHYVLTENINGDMGNGPCWNNPEYRAWITATLKDIFDHYDLDGIQYGAERVGPLSEVLLKGNVPGCFCEHCVRRNEEKGIDAERAKTGYKELYKLMQQVAAGVHPVNGVMASVWHVLQKYHEVLAWNYQWFQADEEIQKMVYTDVKSWNKDAIVGRHIDHQRSSWDLFYRSAVTYEEMAAYTDFIKPILYHDIYGPRLRNWVISTWKKNMYANMDEQLILDYYYAIFNLDKNVEPSLDELNSNGLSPDYVYREVKRCVDGVKGRTDVISGVGIDVPWHLPEGGMGLFPSDPNVLYEAVMKSFEAGATGVLASREYDEMRLSSLEAFGRAVRDWKLTAK